MLQRHFYVGSVGAGSVAGLGAPTAKRGTRHSALALLASTLRRVPACWERGVRHGRGDGWNDRDAERVSAIKLVSQGCNWVAKLLSHCNCSLTALNKVVRSVVLRNRRCTRRRSAEVRRHRSICPFSASRRSADGFERRWLVRSVGPYGWSVVGSGASQLELGVSCIGESYLLRRYISAWVRAN